MIGRNFKWLNQKSMSSILKEKEQEARESLHHHLKKNEWVYDTKALELEKEILRLQAIL